MIGLGSWYYTISEYFEHTYPPAAYMVVFAALDHAVRDHGEGHVHGSDVCHSFIAVAHNLFGPTAEMVLDAWNVRSTEDIGQLVYHLIEVEAIRATEEDSKDDFSGVFNLPEAVRERYRGPCVDREELGRTLHPVSTSPAS